MEKPSNGMNLQYDMCCNNEEVLKAVKLGSKECLAPDLPSKDALLHSCWIIHSKNLMEFGLGCRSLFNLTINSLKENCKAKAVF